MTEFQAFWQAYPRRVGKLDAVKAYAKARALASADEILAGVEAYKKHKPEYCDYAHPATWLNKGRWMDEYDDLAAKPTPSTSDDWFIECQQLHQGACGGSLRHRTRMLIDTEHAKRA